MVTQIDVARRVGLDVSSVNKILNQVPGPKFRKESIALVHRVARELGYQRRENKHDLRRQVAELEKALYDLNEAYNNRLILSDRYIKVIEEFIARGRARAQAIPKKKAMATA